MTKWQAKIDVIGFEWLTVSLRLWASVAGHDRSWICRGRASWLLHFVAPKVGEDYEEGRHRGGPLNQCGEEGSGNSGVVFDSRQALGKNGVLVLASVTGGDKMIQIPADRINLEFVLGNKVMVGTVNANREYFEMGVGDMAQAEAEYPGWLRKLLTDPVKGLENYAELFEKLKSPNGAIKVFCEVA